MEAVATCERSQFDYGGVSACTSIDCEVAIRWLHGRDMTSQEVDAALKTGSALTPSDEHQAAAELLFMVERYMEQLALAHNEQFSIKEGAASYAGALLGVSTTAGPGEKLAMILTKPPESVCVFYDGTEGSKFEWLLFDSHPRDYSASIGRQPSAVVGFSSLGALAEHLGTIIPPFIDPEGGEDSYMDMMYNVMEITAVRLQEGCSFQEWN